MEIKNLTDIATKVALKTFALLFLILSLKIAAEYHKYSQHLAEQRAINLSQAGHEVECTSEKVKINQASASELEKLPGVGKVLARSIVRHRERHGSFRRIEGLLAVRGIGEKKFRKLSPMICTQ